MTQDVMTEQGIFLSSKPAQRRDRRLALMVVSVSLLIFAAVVPFARRPLAEVWPFIPIYESALAMSDLITAAILFGQFKILRSRALLVLANGYLATAAISVPHVLSYPGVFSPTGLLGAGPQSTAWLYMFWHAVFPIAVISYVMLKDRDGEAVPLRKVYPRAMLLNVAATLVLVTALSLIALGGKDLLPSIMIGQKYSPTMIIVVSTVWALSLLALVLLWRQRPHSVLDLWLMVVMCAWLIDVALSAALNAARFDVGFYAGRVYGLFAATIVLLVLLLETSALYARLAELFALEQREHRQEADERRRIFDSSLDLILVTDRKGTFLRVNPSSIAILGYEPNELIGRSAVEFVYPEDLDSIRAEMRSARRGRLIRNFATRYSHKNGRIVTLAWSGVWSEPEQRYYFIGRDVTEQKRIERMKDEFISTVNHELRTPITTIMGPLSLLTRIEGLPDHARRLIMMAQSNSVRLAKLVSDILDVDKIDSGKMVFNFQRVDAKPLVEHVIEANAAMADKFGVRVRSAIGAAEFSVRSDPDRLAQAITNLLSNAIKFSPAGGEIVVSIEARQDSVRIAVRDHGPGIPEEFRARLFEKFALVDATDARQKGGTGLGLSIVKQTMIRLGGDVGYAAAPSGGSVFHVDVPIWHEELTTSTTLEPCGQTA